MSLRRHLPATLRTELQALRRQLRDRRSGLRQRFVNVSGPTGAWPERLVVEQAIRPSALVTAKLHNLRRAAAVLNDRLIPPGALLSLGHLIGPPTARRGYQAGRMLAEGKVVAEEGGGLCQLSGVIYLLGLQAGLRVEERHPHSLDLYTETTRFCELGSDATLVWAYKDLRLENTHAHPVAFRFQIAEDRLRGALCAPESVVPHEVVFVREDLADGSRRVRTVVDGVERHEDRYVPLDPEGGG